MKLEGRATTVGGFMHIQCTDEQDLKRVVAQARERYGHSAMGLSYSLDTLKVVL